MCERYRPASPRLPTQEQRDRAEAAEAEVQRLQNVVAEQPGLVTRAWEKVRGESVGAVGLLGDVMADWGVALGKWSSRHMFTPRELDRLTRDIPPGVPTPTEAGPR